MVKPCFCRLAAAARPLGPAPMMTASAFATASSSEAIRPREVRSPSVVGSCCDSSALLGQAPGQWRYDNGPPNAPACPGDHHDRHASAYRASPAPYRKVASNDGPTSFAPQDVDAADEYPIPRERGFVSNRDPRLERRLHCRSRNLPAVSGGVIVGRDFAAQTDDPLIVGAETPVSRRSSGATLEPQLFARLSACAICANAASSRLNRSGCSMNGACPASGYSL